MNRNSRGTKPARFLFVAATVVAAGAACSRADASRAAGQAAPLAATLTPGSNSTVAALEIAEHDCAAGSVQNLRSGRGGNLDDLRAVSLSRVPVHSAATRYSWSGWRLEVASQRGPGAIVLIEMPRGVCYLGQGLFLGWTQDRLASAYGKLSPRPEAVPDDFLQLD